MKKYDIFICYRRHGGFETAQLIDQHLKNLGYKVFLDLENLRGGKFNTQLLEVIRNCKDFIVILPNEGLDRCFNEDDWVRQELECAIENNKNIVPVLLRGFQFPDSLPDSIKDIKNFNGVSASDHQYFDASLEKIRNFLKSKKGFNNKKVKSLLIIIFSLMIFISGIIGFIEWQKYREFTSLCRSISTRMEETLIEMHESIYQYKNTSKDWNIYVENISKIENLNDTIYLYSNIVKKLEKQLNRKIMFKDFPLTNKQKDILRRNGVLPEDIETYFKLVIPNYYGENLLNSLYQSMISYSAPYKLLKDEKLYIERIQNLVYIQDIVSDFCFYNVLSMISDMPKASKKNFQRTNLNLTYFPNVPLDYKKQFYEDLCDKTNNKLEAAINNLK